MAKPALLYLPYLPSYSWCLHWLHHPVRVLEKEENFVKSSGRNRCEIVSANGRQTLSIPILGGRDHHQLYKDVRIANTTSWQRQHWQSIRSAYGSAPFYEHYADRFQIFYEKRYEFLYDFNLEILHPLLSSLKLESNFQHNSIYEKASLEFSDLRDALAINIANIPAYQQVFADKHGFESNLSALDLLFNEGPQALNRLKTKTPLY